MRLETLIRKEKKGEKYSINNRLNKAMESIEMTESLYISQAIKSSERSKVVEETIAILKWTVTNTPMMCDLHIYG